MPETGSGNFNDVLDLINLYGSEGTLLEFIQNMEEGVLIYDPDSLTNYNSEQDNVEVADVLTN